jgi:hypothetical protein
MRFFTGSFVAASANPPGISTFIEASTPGSDQPARAKVPKHAVDLIRKPTIKPVVSPVRFLVSRGFIPVNKLNFLGKGLK